MVWSCGRILGECETVAMQLLRTAYDCKKEGMNEYSPEVRPNATSVLCANQGDNPCARSMENLFVTTHANFSQLEENADEVRAARAHRGNHI